MWWLLEATVRQVLEKAQADGVAPNAQQAAAFEAAAGNGTPLTIVGTTAQIEVSGILTKTPNWLAAFFGGGNTTYTDITAQIAEAEADKRVQSIEFYFNSPGGNVDGLFEAVDAIAAATKPTKAVVGSMAASAAYALAASADTIEAESRASQVGSLGIRVNMPVAENVVTITSSNAPNKAPDVTTEEGRAVVQEQLDGIEGLFLDAIAEGRGTDRDTIIADYGQGSVFVAGDALKRGMIDSIGPAAKPTVTANATGGTQTEAINMDLNALRAQHPDVYAAAVELGKTEALDAERDRVNAHLEMGKQTGAMDTAIEAIESGEGMTAMLTAKYVTAGMNKNSLEQRGEDNPETDGGADDAERDATASANILNAAAASCGVELEA